MKLILLSTCILCSTNAFAQVNIIKNGNFQDTSFWMLNFYNGAEGNGTVSGNAYRIHIEKPGSDIWNVQLNQRKIALDSGSCYRFSFEVSSSAARTIEASICRDGGDYIPYSGREMYIVTPKKQTFESVFVMQYPTDTMGRVEFNSGKAGDGVAISNVKLVKIQEPFLIMKKPVVRDIAYEGYSVRLAWFTSGFGLVNIEFSADNRANWAVIADAVPDTGAYYWVPGKVYSPWCLIRISSASDPDIFTVSELFELAPRTELINNGTFEHSDTGWNFGVYGGRASGGVISEGFYKISIDTIANESWQIQLTQSGIALYKGVDYTFSFTAYSEKSCTIHVDITRHHSTYTGYLDSSKNKIVLSTEPRQFIYTFTVNDEDNPDVRLDFNVGLANTVVYIDNVSLVKDSKAGMKNGFITKNYHKRKPAIVVVNKGHQSFEMRLIENYSISNLIGRRVSGRVFNNQQNVKKRASGLYIFTNEK